MNMIMMLRLLFGHSCLNFNIYFLEISDQRNSNEIILTIVKLMELLKEFCLSCEMSTTDSNFISREYKNILDEFSGNLKEVAETDDMEDTIKQNNFDTDVAVISSDEFKNLESLMLEAKLLKSQNPLLKQKNSSNSDGYNDHYFVQQKNKNKIIGNMKKMDKLVTTKPKESTKRTHVSGRTPENVKVDRSGKQSSLRLKSNNDNVFMSQQGKHCSMQKSNM